MQLSGRYAAAACAARLSSLAVNTSHHRCNIYKVPSRALKRQISILQDHLYAKCKAIHCDDDPISPKDVKELDDIFPGWLRLAAAILAAACLHLGSSQAADALDLASASEDKLLGIVRSIETQLDSAVTSVRNAVPTLNAPSTSEAAAQQTAARDLINEVYELVEHNFSDARGAGGFDAARWLKARDAALAHPLPDLAAAHSAVRRMLSTLKDPYSRFIYPEEFAAMAKYDVSGVGLNLGTLEDLKMKTGLDPSAAAPASSATSSSSSSSAQGENSNNNTSSTASSTSIHKEGVFVVGIIRGSAAEVAGMRQGDEVLSANGDLVTDLSPFAVASLLQGEENENGKDEGPGIGDLLGSSSSSSGTNSSSSGGSTSISSDVQITVRHLDGNTENLTLIRPQRTPTPSPVVSRMDKQTQVGYIKLVNFNARAQRDVARAVRDLQGAGAQRLILDLRGNRGGLVTEGVEVARLFLQDNAVVVRTEGPRGCSVAPLTAPGPALTSAPLAVLVDGHTASASEILAGALQDNCRAVLVGKRTYGKGLIQSVYELGDGSGVVLTVGKYLTPNGTDIDLDGIVPDFGVTPGAAVADDALAACRLRTAPSLAGGTASAASP